MSKKKATMTLKDFHGGSIPSDLPLPSAPGVIVRPQERSGFDRQAAWGNPGGRPDHRLRPGSADSRNFDDKTPFLTHSNHIGRNFDEDERKPLDGPSGPRRTVSDESLRGLPSRAVEPKIDVSAHGRFTNRPSSTPGSQYSTGGVSGSYAGKFPDMNSVGISSLGVGGSSGAGLSFQNVSGSGVHSVSGPHPNAWGPRKETATVKETAPAPWSAPDAALKLAHASALEKVSSGRWHSKQQINSQTDVEIIRLPETETDSHFRHKDMYSKNVQASRDLLGVMEYNNAALPRQVGKSLTLDDNVHAGAKEVLTLERLRTPMTMESNDSNIGIQLLHQSGKPGGTELLSVPQSELTERPKLKLLPRSKPLENPEPPLEYKPVPQQPTVSLKVENQSQPRGVPNLPKAGNLGPESAHSIIERPKLNLKPRSEALDPAEVKNENKRNTLFGGARPRELVLKERGNDNVAVNNEDLLQPPQRVKQDVVRTERVSVHATSTRYSDKHETPIEHRTGKNTDRQELKFEGEGADSQRKNWRGENWRNKREFDKPQRQQQQQQPKQQLERPPSPDTWRKPAEQATLAPPDAQGLRFGKAASAVELAQAFSRPISDPTTADRTSGQRSLPGRGQIPFSRLTGPAPRPQINGY